MEYIQQLRKQIGHAPILKVGAATVRFTAVALPDGGKYREDNSSMTFTYPDGSVDVVVHLANGDKSFPKERIEVFCGGKVAVLDDFRVLDMVHNGHRKMVKGAQDKGWKDEWVAFTKSIRENGEPPIPYEQLVGVTKASFTSVESIWQKGNQLDV